MRIGHHTPLASFLAIFVSPRNFEGYSASLSYKAGATRNIVGKESFSYFPPIVKAIKKLRRDLGIADAFETKRPGVNIY
ncbi:hypothetical protein A0H81_01497 [Grifola frondosa]|uniref:Uncharacterized protein n=1 Tax=Grifola frondosa TaxID=5627 RepID=A0A1C7MXG8_GRIFR|nr:hypothetical protein A0H81_01497 [Grifola frondosa]